jgi:hypothetical protein
MWTRLFGDASAALASNASSRTLRHYRPVTEDEREDDFDGDQVDPDTWLPYYLPHWSSREAARARYTMSQSILSLRIEADQAPWCPEFDGWLRVSSIQTANLAKHRFREGLSEREPQQPLALFTPRYGRLEVKARAVANPANMVSLWMIGVESRPSWSAEICIFEIFGRDVGEARARVGMGLHPFGDPRIRDDFERIELAIDAREFHVYAAEWSPRRVTFSVDDVVVKSSGQSPNYPMQLMLGIYEFADGPDMTSGPYPKEFAVDWFRAVSTTR